MTNLSSEEITKRIEEIDKKIEAINRNIERIKSQINKSIDSHNIHHGVYR